MSDQADLVADALPQTRGTIQLLIGLLIVLVVALLGGVFWQINRTVNAVDGQTVATNEIKVSLAEIKADQAATKVAVEQRMTNDETIQQRLVDAEIPMLKDANQARQWLDEHSAPPQDRRDRRSSSLVPHRRRCVSL